MGDEERNSLTIWVKVASAASGVVVLFLAASFGMLMTGQERMHQDIEQLAAQVADYKQLMTDRIARLEERQVVIQQTLGRHMTDVEQRRREREDGNSR